MPCAPGPGRISSRRSTWSIPPMPTQCARAGATSSLSSVRVHERMKLPKEIRPATATIRSRIVLEVAAELVARNDQPFTQAKVALRQPYGDGVWRLGLFGSASTDGIDAVVGGEAALAITNPAASLSLAWRG